MTGDDTHTHTPLSDTHSPAPRSSVLLLAPLLAEADPAPSPAPVAQGSDSLHTRFRWMAEHVPAFRVSGTHIHVLSSPDQFYQVMKVGHLLSLAASV